MNQANVVLTAAANKPACRRGFSCSSQVVQILARGFRSPHGFCRRGYSPAFGLIPIAAHSSEFGRFLKLEMDVGIP